MGPRDNQEAFLVTFEWAVTAACWLQEHWATLIAPYSKGLTQAAYRGLDPIEVLEYSKVKATILDYMDINPETFHEQFRKKMYPLGTQPGGTTPVLVLTGP